MLYRLKEGFTLSRTLPKTGSILPLPLKSLELLKRSWLHTTVMMQKGGQKNTLELDMKDREENDPEGRHNVLARDNVRIPKGSRNTFNVGYLPLQKIYYDLKFPSICRSISKQHSFDFDLYVIFSRLIYSQILFPGSKLRITELSKKLFKHPDFEYHQVLRALSVIHEHFDDIHRRVYKNSCKVVDRKSGVVFYDCTNYYFEIEREDEDLPLG